MGFLAPLFLAALAALAIPVAMHLRHRDRNKPFRFPSLMFLERLPIRTAKRRRITDWPLLLLRAAALALLVLAFSRPLWNQNADTAAATRSTALIVLLDRSMSMKHQDMWKLATDSARAAINELSGDDKVAVVLFDDAAEVAQTFTTDKALALAAVDRATPLNRGTRFAPALRAARQLLYNAAGSTGEIVVISDLQRAGASGLADVDVPAGTIVRALPIVPSSHATVSVASVDARRVIGVERPTLSVQARITARELPDAQRVTARLMVNGREAANGSVLVAANGDASIPFDPVPITPGEVIGEVVLQSDAAAHGSGFYFTLPREDALQVFVVAASDVPADETMFLERALAIGRSPAIITKRVTPSQLDVSALGPSAVVFYWDAVPDDKHTEALNKFVANGGGVAFLASRRVAQRQSPHTLVPATFAGIADRVSDRGGSIGEVRYDHTLFAPFREATAALTAARFLRYPRVEAAGDADVIARFDDGLPAVVDRSGGKGHIVLVALPLDDRNGDFPLQPAFLPLLRRLALYTSGHDAAPLWHTTGETWAVPEGIEVPVIAAPDSGITRPERDSVGLAVPLVDAGIYAVYEGRVSGEPRASVAVNVPAAENDLTPVDQRELLLGVRSSDPALDGMYEPVTAAELERRQGFWRFLLAAVVVLMAGETLFSNRGRRGIASRMAAAYTDRSPT